MKIKSILLAFTFSALTILQACAKTPPAEPAKIKIETLVHKPSIKQARTAEEVLNKLQRYHYEKKHFDDNLSSLFLDSYIERLDPGKLYFTQDDINSFEQYRTTLDDAFRRGNLKPGFEIFNIYKAELIEHLEDLIAALPERIDALDFDKEESIIIKSELLQWAQDEKTLQDRARKNLKNAVLSLKIEDKDNEKIIKSLTRRYTNQLNRLKQFNNDDVFQIYLNTLTELYDPHTNYFTPQKSENFDIEMKLSLEGIGALLSQEDEFTVVQRLIPAGPADKQGELKPKDRIIGVAQDDDGEMVDVVEWRLDEVVNLIRGKKDSVVRLNIERKNNVGIYDTLEIKIVRNKVKLEEQAAKKDIIELHHNGELRKLGVITIPTFYIDFEAAKRRDPNYKSTTRDVKKLLKELEEESIEGLVIDLRGNGGGSLLEAKQLTGLFVERGPVVQIRSSNGRIKPESNYPNPNYYNGPVVVLIDRLSASASEIFAGAIQDYQRGLIVGSPSFGKGTVQSYAEVQHGSLKLTESKFYRISGDSTQHRGVIPDIELPSLFNLDEIGESALDNALSWDRIKNIKPREYGDFDSIEGQLLDIHKKRMADDPDYSYLIDKIALSKKYDDLSSISLNEKARRELIDSNKAEQDALENKYRLAKGLPPLEEKEEDALDNENSELAKNDPDQESDETDKEEDARANFLLNEAGFILLDAMTLTKKELPVAASQ